MTEFDDFFAEIKSRSGKRNHRAGSVAKSPIHSAVNRNNSSFNNAKNGQNKSARTPPSLDGSLMTAGLVSRKNHLNPVGGQSLSIKLDSQAQILAIQGNALKLLGYREQELLQKSWINTFFPISSARELKQAYAEFVADRSQVVFSFAAAVLTKSGAVLEFMWQVMPLNLGAQAAQEYLCLGIDIGKHKQQVEDLQKRSITLDKIEQIARIGSLEWDIDKKKLRISKELYRIFELEPGESDSNLESLINHFATSNLRASDSQTTAGPVQQESFDNELRIVAKDGSERYLWSDSLLSYDENGVLNHVIGIAQDVTEMKKSESSLKKTQHLLLGTEKLAHVGSWEWDVQNDKIIWSPELYRIYGIASPQQVQLDFDAVISYTHPEDLENLNQYVSGVMETGTGSPFSFRIRRSDGSIRHLLIECEAEFDQSHSATHLVGYARDVTERVTTNNALREGNLKFSLLFNQSVFGVVKVDSNSGKFLEVNQRLCNMLGYSAEELTAVRFIDITHPLDADRDFKLWSELRQGTLKVSQFEKRYLRKNGTTLWTNISIIRFDRKKFPWHFTIIEDISIRKEAEQKLEQQRKEQQRILNSISDSILVLNNKLEIINCNKSTNKIFAIEDSDLLRRPLRRLIPESIGNNALFYSLLRRNGSTSRDDPSMEVVGIKLTGERFPLRISICELPSETSGDSRQMLTCHDLSKEKLQEEQLRRTQKMDALGKLTGGIAHDYNNMLGVIVGYSKLLHDALEHNPKLSSYIDEIQKATNRGTRLSRKLLAFSKNIPLDTEILEINTLLLSERDMLQKTLTPRITLQYELGENLWPVCINSGDFEDALLNICINAMQAIEFNGTITITTRNTSLTRNELLELSLPDGEYVTIDITDTGVGISPSYLSNIFDPFFTTKGHHGVGLGLSMVYGFVKRSQGDIKVSSIPGKGSVFTLFFPRFRDESIHHESRKPNKENNRQLAGVEKILVVDDEPALLTLCREILGSHGYQCETASSAEQALESVNFNNIDMLVSDVIMPGMDGYQFVESALRINPALKVLLISGYTDNRQNSHGSNSSLRLLQKPFTANELLNQVRAILNSEDLTSSNSHPRILVMDDDENIRSLYKINLQRLGYEVLLTSDGEETIQLYSQALHKKEAIDVVIMDLSIPGGMGGEETASALLKIDPDACLVVSSGDSYGDIMNNFSAYGFKAVMEKNFDRNKLKQIIDGLLSKKKSPLKEAQPA